MWGRLNPPDWWGGGGKPALRISGGYCPYTCRVVVPKTYTCVYPIDIFFVFVRWLSGTRPTSQPLFGGSDPPPLPMHIHRHCRDLSRFGHMHFWICICMGRGGGRPSGSGWEVGRVPDNHMTKQKMSIGYTHAYVVDDHLTSARQRLILCFCVTGRLGNPHKDFANA